MPVRRHPEKETNRERFAGRDRIRIRHQLRLDQLATFISLRRNWFRNGNDQQAEKCPRKMTPRDHAVTYHQRVRTATCRPLAPSLV